MAFTWPDDRKGKRIRGDERAAMAAEARRLYESGKSIRDIHEISGRSFGFIRNLLVESGVTFRGRGGATRRKAS